MSRLYYGALILGAILLFVPALVVFAGFWIALALVLLWILFWVGGKIGIDVLKERQSGVGAAKAKRNMEDRNMWERE